jgi:MFS family permease
MGDSEDPHKQKSKFRLPRNVIALGLVSLFTDISSEMLYPIMPFFLTVTLGAPMWALGIVEGAADGMSSLLRGLSGYLSDRFCKRKFFIVLGYGASALAKPITALAQSWGFVLGTRLLDRFGKSVRTAPRDALISAQIDKEHRGYAFGFHRSLDTIGAVLGPIIALLLVWVFEFQYRSLFVLACIPAAIGVLIAAVLVREVRDPQVQKKATVHIPLKNWLSPSLVKFFIVTGMFALANSSNTFILLRARQVFSSHADVLAIMGYIVFNLSFALLATPMGILSDRMGRKKVIIAGFFTYALVYGALAFFATSYTIWAIFFVYGIFESLTHGVTKALVADLTPPEFRGTALGTANAIEGLGTLVAGIVTGVLWSISGPTLAFSIDAGLAILAAILFMTFRIKSDNN